MHAQKDEYIEEAANTIYRLSQDEKVRLQCEAREDYYRRQRSVQHYIEEQAEQIMEKSSLIADLDAALLEKDSRIADLGAALIERDSAIAKREADLMAKDSLIAELQAQIERMRQNSATN